MKTALTRWLHEPPVTGWYAFFGGIAATVVPTVVRAAVSGSVTGCEFTPYLPFVLVAAILIGWWQAVAVALASVAVLGGLFASPGGAIVQKQCFISGAGVFLASSAMIVAVAVFLKRLMKSVERRGAEAGSGGIIFSIDQGDVWASFYGQGTPLRLGPQGKVAKVMEEFLARAHSTNGAALPD